MKYTLIAFTLAATLSACAPESDASKNLANVNKTLGDVQSVAIKVRSIGALVD